MAVMNVFTRAGDAGLSSPARSSSTQGDLRRHDVPAVAEGQIDIVLDGRVIESVTAGGIFG